MEKNREERAERKSGEERAEKGECQKLRDEGREWKDGSQEMSAENLEFREEARSKRGEARGEG